MCREFAPPSAGGLLAKHVLLTYQDGEGCHPLVLLPGLGLQRGHLLLTFLHKVSIAQPGDLNGTRNSYCEKGKGPSRSICLSTPAYALPLVLDWHECELLRL